LIGQPGDLIAAKTELKITQRLRLDQYKLEDLERKLRTSVTNALVMNNNIPHINANGPVPIGPRKSFTAANQTKFVILISSPKIHIETSGSVVQQTSNEKVKNEVTTPPRTNEDEDHLELKKEPVEDNAENSDEEDESSLSRLISYLAV
jgi:hypothetical protein